MERCGVVHVVLYLTFVVFLDVRVSCEAGHDDPAARNVVRKHVGVVSLVRKGADRKSVASPTSATARKRWLHSDNTVKIIVAPDGSDKIMSSQDLTSDAEADSTPVNAQQSKTRIGELLEEVAEGEHRHGNAAITSIVGTDIEAGYIADPSFAASEIYTLDGKPNVTVEDDVKNPKDLASKQGGGPNKVFVVLIAVISILLLMVCIAGLAVFRRRSD